MQASHGAQVGSLLRRARERRGESLAAAARNTRISTSYLEALEKDAPIAVFPAATYARSFLRQYARYLGLDEERLLEVFGAREGVQQAAVPKASPSAGLLPNGPPRVSLSLTRRRWWWSRR